MENCRAQIRKDADLSEVRNEAELERLPGLRKLLAAIDVSEKPARNRRIIEAYNKHGYTMNAQEETL